MRCSAVRCYAALCCAVLCGTAPCRAERHTRKARSSLSSESLGNWFSSKIRDLVGHVVGHVVGRGSGLGLTRATPRTTSRTTSRTKSRPTLALLSPYSRTKSRPSSRPTLALLSPYSRPTAIVAHHALKLLESDEAGRLFLFDLGGAGHARVSERPPGSGGRGAAGQGSQRAHAPTRPEAARLACPEPLVPHVSCAFV